MDRAERPSTLVIWWLACRPKTLLAAVVPVVVGTGAALGVQSARWAPAAAALLGAILIQIGTNFANDVFDFEQGADTEARVGPTRAVAAGWLSPARMRAGMIAAFGGAVLVGCYLVAVGGWPVVAIGVASIISGVFYTATRNSLAYLGLGDIFVMLFFGFVAVGGTYYVQTGMVHARVLWAAVPVGAWATNIIIVNNLRDRVTDAEAGKRTLAVRFGRRFCLAEYGLLGLASYAVVIGLAAAESAPWLLLPVVTLPLALATGRRVARSEGPALNPLLGATARVLALFGLTWAAGLALS